jgi:hypothetical protein
MKTILVLGIVFLASTACLVAQAEKVKSKARDLKRNIEAQQTNSAPAKTNAPPRSR